MLCRQSIKMYILVTVVPQENGLREEVLVGPSSSLEAAWRRHSVAPGIPRVVQKDGMCRGS